MQASQQQRSSRLRALGLALLPTTAVLFIFLTLGDKPGSVVPSLMSPQAPSPRSLYRLPSTLPAWKAPGLLPGAQKEEPGNSAPLPRFGTWLSSSVCCYSQPRDSMSIAAMSGLRKFPFGFGPDPTGIPSPILVAFFSAMFANAITTLITFPLDTLKTQQQSPEGTGSPLLDAPAKSKSGWSARATASFIASLFRGISPVLMFGIPCSGLYFLLFELLQSRWNPTQTTLGDLLCACTAQIVSGTLMVPVDMVKVNLQTGASNSGGGAALQGKSMTASLILTYLRDFSFACTQMLIYTWLRRLGGGWEVFAGPIAATIGALISHPFDAIRTRRMLSDDTTESAPFDAYTAGLVPRLALSCASGFIFFTNYEAAKPWVEVFLQRVCTH